MGSNVSGVGCLPAWFGAPLETRRTGEYSRTPDEWMARPFGGRVMISSRKMADKQPIYVECVPGPGGSWQLVRVDLAKPFARGFRSPKQARGWVAKAIKQGILPESVIVVEPAQK